MTLVDNRRYNTLTACPLCGHEFKPQDRRALHFAQEHTLADLGLAD